MYLCTNHRHLMYIEWILGVKTKFGCYSSGTVIRCKTGVSDRYTLFFPEDIIISINRKRFYTQITCLFILASNPVLHKLDLKSSSKQCY
jgi:hypothetical protein